MLIAVKLQPFLEFQVQKHFFEGVFIKVLEEGG